MSRRFLLLVALLFFFTLRGRTQNDLQDPLGSAFRVSIQKKIIGKLPPHSCAVLFSGGLHAYDSQGRFPSPFECDPDFYYLSGIRIPDAVIVLFSEPQNLAEGAVSTLLFLPDQNDQGLASLGLSYDGKFGLKENGMAWRPANQWVKFCKEILVVDSVERIFSKPLPTANFRKPGEPDFQDLGREFYQLLAPGFAFDPQAQRFYKEIQAADTSTLAALKARIDAMQRYQLPAYRDPLLERLAEVKSAQELLQLQKRIAKVKIDLVQLDNWISASNSLKSQAEIGLFKDVSKKLNVAFKASMSRLLAGNQESEIEGIAAYILRKEGCNLPMPLRVASGLHAAQPNYVENASPLEADALCILDFAASTNGFAVRATRTVPVGGAFNGAIGDVYGRVLAIHKGTLEGCKVGARPSQLNDVAAAAFGSLHQQQIFSSNAIGSKHVLEITSLRLVGTGLEKFGIPGEMKAGMLIEVETALYLPPLRGVTEKWQGKGIVLRDYVFVNTAGNEVLTASIPMEKAALSAAVGTTNKAPID